MDFCLHFEVDSMFRSCRSIDLRSNYMFLNLNTKKNGKRRFYYFEYSLDFGLGGETLFHLNCNPLFCSVTDMDFLQIGHVGGCYGLIVACIIISYHTVGLALLFLLSQSRCQSCSCS